MKIIAEIGWNHMGDMSLAKKMIESAAKNGADYCKFQTWSVKNLKKGKWDEDGRREIYESAQLSQDQHYELFEYCKKFNTNFLTTIFNLSDLDFLSNLNKKIIKIGSPEVYNLDLITSCLEKFEVVLLSTGASMWSEVERLKKVKNVEKLVLLHCVSSYPCKPENINFPKMEELKKITKNVGYSGHFEGINDALIALVFGAKYIEKHFTIDNSLPGRDNKFSITPSELLMLKNFRNNLNEMMIDNGLDLQNCEEEIYKTIRGRWSGNHQV